MGVCLLFQCTSLCEITTSKIWQQVWFPPPNKMGSQFNDPRLFNRFVSFTTTTTNSKHLPSSLPNPHARSAFPTHYASNSYTSEASRIWKRRDLGGMPPIAKAQSLRPAVAKVIYQQVDYHFRRLFSIKCAINCFSITFLVLDFLRSNSNFLNIIGFCELVSWTLKQNLVAIQKQRATSTGPPDVTLFFHGFKTEIAKQRKCWCDNGH